jgi:hypothetical protein
MHALTSPFLEAPPNPHSVHMLSVTLRGRVNLAIYILLVPWTHTIYKYTTDARAPIWYATSTTTMYPSVTSPSYISLLATYSIRFPLSLTSAAISLRSSTTREEGEDTKHGDQERLSLRCSSILSPACS